MAENLSPKNNEKGLTVVSVQFRTEEKYSFYTLY